MRQKRIELKIKQEDLRDLMNPAVIGELERGNIESNLPFITYITQMYEGDTEGKYQFLNEFSTLFFSGKSDKIGTYLIRLRHAQGFKSQGSLADEISTSIGLLKEFERGKITPGVYCRIHRASILCGEYMKHGEDEDFKHDITEAFHDLFFRSKRKKRAWTAPIKQKKALRCRVKKG